MGHLSFTLMMESRLKTDQCFYNRERETVAEYTLPLDAGTPFPSVANVSTEVDLSITRFLLGV